MWSKLKQKIIQIYQVNGIEISLLANKEMVINAVTLKLEKNKIIKEKEIHFLHSFDELAKKIPLNFPVAVSVNGRGVLHKKVAVGVPAAKLFESALPNANPNEFYIEVSQFDNFASVSIIRKELLDKIIQELRELKLTVLSVSIGPANIQYLVPFLNFAKQSILKTNNYSIHYSEEHLITDIEAISFDMDATPSKLEYSVGNQYVFSPALLSFASATGLLAEGLGKSTVLDNSLLLKEREDYRYFKYYRTALGALLAGLFIILLINFFIYNHYFTKNAEQQVSSSLTQEEERNTEKLRGVINAKEEFIRDYGWNLPTRLSFYADRIAGLVPESTVLTTMKLYPVNSGFFGENSLMTFKKDTILVAGTCDDPTELNRFANNLRSVPGFKEVNIKNYLYKKEAQNGIFLMEIIII